MPTPTTPAATLRAAAEVLADTERYLSALHGAVARHDNLGADLSCAGCQLRDRITAALAVSAADETQQHEADEQEPVQLRWGPGDVQWDDGTTTIMLSGPAGEPYWLELGPERAAALRDDLGGPDGGEAQQTTAQSETEAYPAQRRWRTETRDPLANEWTQSLPYPDRELAVARQQAREERYPAWADGTPVERRLVRETTTFTVEPTGPVTHLAAGTNAEKCPACEGTNPDYPFLCPGPDAATEESTP